MPLSHATCTDLTAVAHQCSLIEVSSSHHVSDSLTPHVENHQLVPVWLNVVPVTLADMS